VIGDLGGTLQVFEAAIALGKPVIPVSGSGGDAAKAARALSLEARSRDALGPKVLQLVSKPVDSQGRAELAIDGVLDLVRLSSDAGFRQRLE
jgi:hypothetical protein